MDSPLYSIYNYKREQGVRLADKPIPLLLWIRFPRAGILLLRRRNSDIEIERTEQRRHREMYRDPWLLHS